MAAPTYVRSGSESSFPSATDSREKSIEVTGLREKKLIALLIWLVILSFLALALLIINIVIITSLQMNQHGLKFIKFHTVRDEKTGEIEKLVHFNGNSIDLGEVVSNGHVGGYPDQDLNVQGSRIIISGAPNVSRVLLQDTGCRVENANNFQIVNHAGRPIFSALQPLINIDKKIKKVSTNKIITNKVRSPVDENLRIDVENLSIRGNEGIRMEANKVKWQGTTGVFFNTSKDGSVYLHGRVFLPTGTRGLQQSPSPALSASIDAFRVCVCSGAKPKLFLVPGNKPCQASNTVCP